MTGELWPFRPLAGESGETLAWLTDPLGGRTGEQRIALRPAPRQTFRYAFHFDHGQYSRAKTFARRNGAEPVSVPVWVEGTGIGSAVAGSADTIAFDTANADYRVGSQLVVWDSDLKAVLAEIAAIAADSITLTAALGTAFDNPTVAPVRQALMIEGMEADRQRFWRNPTIRFQVEDNKDISGASPFSQYQSIDVMTDTPERVSDLAESIVRASVFVDNGSGPIAVETRRNYADFGQSLGFLDLGKAALWRRRKWLHGLYGMQRAFWLPSFANDLKLQAAFGSGDTNVSVASIAPTGFYLGKHVMIELKSGARHFREITNAANAGATDTLTLSSSLGVAVDPADMRLFSFLSLVRLASDRVSFNYRFTNLTTVAFPVTEVPA